MTIKQLEDEKDDLTRQLEHERQARLFQEQLNEEQLKFQRTITEDINNAEIRVPYFLLLR